MSDDRKTKRARRGRGEGSIYQRSDGRWCASFSAGINGSGKRRRRVVYGATKKEVQEELRKLGNDYASGRPIDAQQIRLGQFLDSWLENSVKGKVAPTTHDRYKVVVDHQLKPHLGGMKAADLQAIHVEQFYATLVRAGCSSRAQQLAGVVLGAALKHAVRLGILRANPCREIPKAKVAKKEMKVWEQTQAAAFLKAGEGDRLHAMYVVALAGGLRQGELFGLQWADVDFDVGAVTVRRSVEEIRGKLRLKEPKTGKGRKVEMPSFAMRALERHRGAMLAKGHIASHVFCAPDGGLLRKGNVYRRSFVPLVTRADVPRIRFHDLRHTCATLLLLAGENVKVVSERLGHASIKVTLEIYAHVLPTMQRAAADKLQRMLG